MTDHLSGLGPHPSVTGNGRGPSPRTTPFGLGRAGRPGKLSSSASKLWDPTEDREDYESCRSDRTQKRAWPCRWPQSQSVRTRYLGTGRSRALQTRTTSKWAGLETGRKVWGVCHVTPPRKPAPKFKTPFECPDATSRRRSKVSGPNSDRRLVTGAQMRPQNLDPIARPGATQTGPKSEIAGRAARPTSRHPDVVRPSNSDRRLATGAQTRPSSLDPIGRPAATQTGPKLEIARTDPEANISAPRRAAAPKLGP